MFETLDRPGLWPPLLRYFAQLFLCYPAVLIAARPFTALIRVLGFTGDYPSRIHFAGYDALICLVVAGPIVGYLTGRFVPPLMGSGRWIWALPAAFLVWDSIDLALMVQTVPYLPGKLFAYGGNEGLGVYLLTLPACSAMGYSLGMALVGARERWSAFRSQWSIHWSALVLAWVGIFCVLALPLRLIETTRINAWSKVRDVVDYLMLVEDANTLCASKPTAYRPVPRGAVVQSLEHRVCGGNQLLEPSALAQAGSWQVERVKLLTGPNAGLEGWVLAYGLIETMRP